MTSQLPPECERMLALPRPFRGESILHANSRSVSSRGVKYEYCMKMGFAALLVGGLLTGEWKQGIIDHSWHASHPVRELPLHKPTASGCRARIDQQQESFLHEEAGRVLQPFASLPQTFANQRAAWEDGEEHEPGRCWQPVCAADHGLLLGILANVSS